MNAHSSHTTHGGSTYEKDLGFGRVLVILPTSMILLILYVAICWFGGSSSLKKEMIRKQVQSVQTGDNNGTSP